MSTQISGRVSIGGQFTPTKAEELYNVLAELSGCPIIGINDIKEDLLHNSTGTLDFFKSDEVEDGKNGITYFNDYGAPIEAFEPIIVELIKRNCCFDCWIFGKEHYGLLDTLLDMRIVIKRIKMEKPTVLVGNIEEDVAVPTPDLIKIFPTIDDDALSDKQKLATIKECYPNACSWEPLEPFVITET